MDVEVVVCSSSGKPIFHFKKPPHSSKFQSISKENTQALDGADQSSGAANDDRSAAGANTHSFVSSLQGLLSFVNCTQQEDLHEIEADACRCIFHTVENILSYAVIVRGAAAAHDDDGDRLQSPPPPLRARCLARFLRLLHVQIVFVLSDRGLDVLRKQPGYDLRELLIGTERVMYGLSTKWLTHPSFRFKDFGIPFLRLHPEDRAEITQTIEYEHIQSQEAQGMICGVLLAAGKVVAIAQPRRKQFSILVDDLLLLTNFIYETPSFAKSETWTPVCLPSFNASGFLHAYVVFLTSKIALVILSTQQSPEQFHHFQAKRVFIEQRLTESGAIERIIESVAHEASWRPHHDMPLVHHFVYKNELTGECAMPQLAFPFSSVDADEEDHDGDGDDSMLAQLMDQYAHLQHRMYASSSSPSAPQTSQVLGKRLKTLHDRLTARVVMHRTSSALYMGVCADDHCLLVWFDALAASDGHAALQEKCQLLLDRLKRDDELMAVSLFGTSASLWP